MEWSALTWALQKQRKDTFLWVLIALYMNERQAIFYHNCPSPDVTNMSGAGKSSIKRSYWLNISTYWPNLCLRLKRPSVNIKEYVQCTCSPWTTSHTSTIITRRYLLLSILKPNAASVLNPIMSFNTSEARVLNTMRQYIDLPSSFFKLEYVCCMYVYTAISGIACMFCVGIVHCACRFMLPWHGRSKSYLFTTSDSVLSKRSQEQGGYSAILDILQLFKNCCKMFPWMYFNNDASKWWHMAPEFEDHADVNVSFFGAWYCTLRRTYSNWT